MSFRNKEKIWTARRKINQHGVFYKKIRIKLDPILKMTIRKKIVVVKSSDSAFDQLNELMNEF